jgi:sulfhydrogenase subunit delta
MKPRIGIFALSGCWGEQIVILNCEDLLLDIVGAVEIVDFLGGSSQNDEKGPILIAFVEGSVGSAREEAKIKEIRARSTLVVACGSCACFGGISAMDSPKTREQLAEVVYGPGTKYDLHPHRPLSDYVKVDLNLPGCPMEKEEFLKAVSNLLAGDPPVLPSYPVCLDCKFKENDCLLLSKGLPCAGPVTTAGCEARCPSYNTPCIGCRGPVDEANMVSIQKIFAGKKIDEREIRHRLRAFAAPVLDRAAGRSST